MKSSTPRKPESALSRRECMIIGLGGATAVALTGCAPLARRLATHPQDLRLPAGNVEPELRLLNRAGFGARPGDVARLRSTGWNNYLAQQMAGDATESISLKMQLQKQDVEQISDPDIEDLPKEEVIRQLQQSALLRAVYSENQLKWRMVDFWTNHFNVYSRKGDSAFRKGSDERDVIHKNALGSFPDLLRASSHSPAMLAFLDNPQNFSRHPNENYARELMELHTLGVGGGYTQRDVEEVARCFTGWTIENRFLRPKGTLRFDASMHDDGAKQVLGHTIAAGGGEKDAAAVLGILVEHPSTARYIAKKLVLYFYGAEDPRLIQSVAERFVETRGHIPSLLRPLLDPRVLADAPPKIRRPFDLVVAAVRNTGGDTDGNHPLQAHLSAMGEPLYQWPMPDGYPVKAAAWSAGMLPRWNFAHQFATGAISGTLPGSSTNTLEAVLGTEHAHQEKIRRIATSDVEALALALASPDFQWC